MCVWTAALLQLYLFVRSLLTALVVLQSSYAASDRQSVVAVINQAAAEATGAFASVYRCDSCWLPGIGWARNLRGVR
jgi:hypothetical protein